MRAGTLDRVVTIARASDTLDEFRSPVMAWSTVATVRARIVEQATAETTGDPGSITTRTVTLESRFVAGIVPGDRLTLDGADYLVKDVREIGRRRGLTIVAEGAV